MSLRQFLWIFVGFQFFFISIKGQECNLDSLKQELSKAKQDTLRCNLLAQLADCSNEGAWEKYSAELKVFAEKKYNESKTEAERKFYGEHLTTSMNSLGVIANKTGEIPKAIEIFQKCIEINKKIGNKKSMGDAMNNLGIMHQFQGNIPKALEIYANCLKMREEIKDTNGISYSLYNIASILQSQGETQKALEYYERCEKLRESINDKRGIADIYNNMAMLFQSKKEYEKALEYDFKSLKLREEVKYKVGIAYSLNNLGSNYKFLGKLELALDYFQKSLKLFEESEFKKGVAFTLNNIGQVYFLLNKRELGLQTDLRAMKISKELGFPDQIKHAAESLYKIYKINGDHHKALEYHELFVLMRDSLNNIATRKSAIKSQMKYEYEKQAAADSVSHAKENEIKNAELAKQAVEIKAKRNQQYALFGGLFLVILFAGFMFNRYKITQRQKRIIEIQKTIVEEKQKEILDSIHYARRIQATMMPTERSFSNLLGRVKKK